MPKTAARPKRPARAVRGSGVVALMTDFGTRDPYVGTMKGAILSACPRARIIDITHDVKPQDLLNAYFMLQNTYPYFPKGTLFVAVVDPGVGTDRRILCVESERHLFLAPDNGILSFLFQRDRVRAIVNVKNDAYFRKPVSNTFHGRDIFAPVAGHLAGGLDPRKLGPGANDMVRLTPPGARVRGDAVIGRVVSIDRFGNLITDIPGDRLAKAKAVRVGGVLSARIVRTYADGKPGEVLALVGSHGHVEIAAPSGSAAETTGAAVGAAVELDL